MTSRIAVRVFGVLSCLAALLLLPGSASAQATKLDALVAEVSTNGTAIDPALSAMAKSFKRNGLAFTNYNLVSRSSLSLTAGQEGSVGLGGTGQASVTLVKVEPDGKALVRLNTPGTSGEYSISPGGELSMQVGTVENGKIFLILRR